MRTDEELKQLAKDFLDGKVFFSGMVKEAMLLPTVFMPLLFLDEMQRLDLVESGVVDIFEYMEKAGPRGINGYPCFMSYQTINAMEQRKLKEYVGKLKAAIDSVMETA